MFNLAGGMVGDGAKVRGRLGSALTYVLVVVAGTSVAVLALVAFSGQSYRKQIASENKLAAQYAFEGAVAQIRSEEARNLITAPVTKNVTVGGITSSVSVVDNDATMANTHRVDVTTTAQGDSYAKSFVIGVADPDCHFNYALSLRSADTFSSRVNTYNTGGIYVGGNLAVNTWSCSDAGNLKVAGTVGGSYTMTVAGTTYTNAAPIATPAITSGNYLSNADSYYGSSTSFSGGTPPSNYYLIYVNGSVTLNSGTYGGKAIIFCTGNVTVNGTMTYANSTSQLVVICLGDLRDGTSGATAVGTYYVGGDLVNDLTFTVTRGSIAARSVIMSSRISVTYDQYFKNNPSQMQTYMLPGYWP